MDPCVSAAETHCGAFLTVPPQIAVCVVFHYSVSTNVGKNELDDVSPSVILKTIKVRTLAKSKAFISVISTSQKAGT